MEFNLDYVRSQFPALQDEWTFFDNAGGSHVLKPVSRRICQYLLSSPVQLGATYETSALAGRRVADAAEAMATFVNAGSASEVILGPSTSMLLRVLST
jgi:selenocysteine lyase/cysteine desulfurase